MKFRLCIRLMLITILSTSTYLINAQAISINNNGIPADSSAMLDVQSTDRGILVPRLNTYQQTNIANPATGLLVFNMDSLDFFFYDGNCWLGMFDKQDSLYQWQCGMPVYHLGQNYNTVQIGSQCWMSENMNAGLPIDDTYQQTDNDSIEKYCYENEPDSCVKYGGLYQWGELMQYVTDSAAQGICPEGWHIPTDYEWRVLEGTVDSQYGVGDPVWLNSSWRGFDVAKKLKSQTGWYDNGNGTDEYNFSMIPAGHRGNYFALILKESGYWTSSTISQYSWLRQIFWSDDRSSRGFTTRSTAYSVRCLMDQ